MKKFNEKLNIATQVLNDNITDLTEEELDAKIVEKYASDATDEFTELQDSGTDSINIIMIAYDYYSDSNPHDKADAGDISTDPYEDNKKANESKNSAPPQDVKTDKKTTTAKVTTTTEDVTHKAAMSLPGEARNKLSDYIENGFESSIAKSNSSESTGFLINTPVRQYLYDKTFIVSDDSAAKFLEKYEKLVIDDNQYDPNNPKKVLVEGDNVKAFKDIKSKLQGKEPFDVNVPLAQSQKVVGIEITTKLEGNSNPEIIKIDEVAAILLKDYCGQIPGSVGIQVTSIVNKKSTNSQDHKKDKSALVPKIVYVGKPKAMKDQVIDGKTIENNYIKHTAIALNKDASEDKFGMANNTITVKSTLKFKIMESKPDATPRTVRVSGKIEVPFFERMPEYEMLGSVETCKTVKELTLQDKDVYIQLVQGYTAISEKTASIIASSWNIQGLLDAIDKEKKEEPPMIDEKDFATA